MTCHKVELSLTTLPSLITLYSKALAKQLKRQPNTGSTLNHQQNKLQTLFYHLPSQALSTNRIERYASVCGFSARQSVPATYLHNIAFKLHMTVMTHREWPLPVMGTVHRQNQIEQYGDIDFNRDIFFTCTASAISESEKMFHFSFEVLASQNNELKWQDTSHFVRVKPSASPAGSNTKGITKHNDVEAPSRPVFQTYQSIDVAKDIGRRYSLVSGDANPIHLTPLTAKLFGFKQPIAHGMWAQAHCAALLDHQTQGALNRFNIEFKRPIFLPAQLTLGHSQIEEFIQFALFDRETFVVVLDGSIEPISNVMGHQDALNY